MVSTLYVGNETDGLYIDYKGKYTGQLQVIKDNYATFAVPYNVRTTTTMSMARASAAMTAAWRLRRHELCRELQRITSKRATHTRRCSSTTTQTIWVAVVINGYYTRRVDGALFSYKGYKFNRTLNISDVLTKYGKDVTKECELKLSLYEVYENFYELC